MRSKSPELKEKIKDFIIQFHKENMRDPSTAEIGRGLSIDKSTAYRYLVAMRECSTIVRGASVQTLP